MKTFQEFMEAASGCTGTYAAMSLCPDSTSKLNQYINQHGIPNPVPSHKFHSTLLYSRKKCEGYTGDPDACYNAKISGLEVWPNRDGENALVAKLDAPEMVARHKHLMAMYGATYDFEHYVPHVTLSYNIGEFVHTKLPPFEHSLNLKNEKQDDLDLKWADK